MHVVVERPFCHSLWAHFLLFMPHHPPQRSQHMPELCAVLDQGQHLPEFHAEQGKTPSAQLFDQLYLYVSAHPWNRYFVIL